MVPYSSLHSLTSAPLGLTVAETHGGLIYLAVIPAFAFFLSVVEGRCLLSVILRTRFLQYLGTISYSFYLWSPVVTYPLKIAIETATGLLPDPGSEEHEPTDP